MAEHTIDIETYWAPDYSLSKMQTDEYVYDSRFEIILIGVDDKWHSGTKDSLKDFLLSTTNPKKDTFIAHHAAFDGFVLAEQLGIRPSCWVDTLSMARAALPWLEKFSLDFLAKHFRLPEKRYSVLNSYKGYRRADFSQAELDNYASYCLHDIYLARQLYNKLLPLTPPEELWAIDMVIRMFTEPSIGLDADMLWEIYQQEIVRKDELLAQCKIDKKDLMSNPKFAEWLRIFGIDPPMKISARTGKETFAFAKSDKAFTALLEHEDPAVQALVAARLGVKSTISETRALRLYKTATRGRKLFPVMLSYWGAKTTGRMSGTNGINAQNIPARGRGSELRKALIAPPGKMIVVGDSANIELRCAMACAGETAALDKLRAGVDLYVDFASNIFSCAPEDVTKPMRFLGKVAMLSLQYGVGPEKFMNTVRLLMDKEYHIDINEARRIVNLYRTTYSKIVQLWGHCGGPVLRAIRDGESIPVDVNGWFTTRKNGFAHDDLPGVVYDKIEKDGMTGEWSYSKGKLYGGKVVENLCQHMARHIVMWQTVAVHKFYPVALSVHDEVVCVVDEAKASECEKLMDSFLRVAPPWCRRVLPLSAEVHVGRSYGECK